MNGFRDERDRLLDIYARSKGEERIRILARLVVLDEEIKHQEAEKHDHV